LTLSDGSSVVATVEKQNFRRVVAQPGHGVIDSSHNHFERQLTKRNRDLVK